MKCPVDGELLVMTERSGVEIDYCPRCRGVWLDRGELDKIVDAAAGAMVLPDPTPAPAPAPQPRVHQEPPREERRSPERKYEKGKRYKKKKRKGGFADMLEDLFDFD